MRMSNRSEMRPCDGHCESSYFSHRVICSVKRSWISDDNIVESPGAKGRRG